MPGKIAQHVIEVVTTDDDNGNAFIAQHVVEVVHAWAAPAAPSGSFGVAVSQSVLEVLEVATDAPAHVSQSLLEVLIKVDDPAAGSSGGTTSFGYAV